MEADGLSSKDAPISSVGQNEKRDKGWVLDPRSISPYDSAFSEW